MISLVFDGLLSMTCPIKIIGVSSKASFNVSDDPRLQLQEAANPTSTNMSAKEDIIILIQRFVIRTDTIVYQTYTTNVTRFDISRKQ
jgi:hypothetical protein